MRFRAALLLTLLTCARAALGQVCFTVAQADDLRPLVGCVALDARRVVLAVSDAQGRLCVSAEVDSVHLESAGREPRWVTMEAAVPTGMVLLRAAQHELEPLTIEPWPTTQDRLALASSHAPDSATLAGFERSSLRSALLWAPGVQMDQRGLGGSTRLSIRGSLLRSPYGVRGVKVYWGPLPLTLADGSTPLELLDPALVNGMDVVRSVGSPAYGSAPAGLVLARPYLPVDQEPSVSGELIGGPNGYYRMAVQAANATPRGATSAGLVKQGNDGYRQQEWSDRVQGWLVSRWRGKRSITQAFLTGQQANWALPGSVDSLTAYTDPRAARPYSAKVNAHVEKQQFFGGLQNELRLGDALRVRSSVHAQVIDKLNPYGTSAAASGYKDEGIAAGGGRLSLSGELRPQAVDLAWELGLEALVERDRLAERAYADGVIGDLRTQAVSRVGNLNGFATLQAHRGRFTVMSGVGFERTLLKHEDELRDTVLTSQQDPVVYPSIGVQARVKRDWLLHARYAESVSRPTLWELLGTAGIFNSTLRPEHVSEVEAGLTIGSDTAMFPFSAVIYWRTTDGLIVPRTATNGVDQEYVNAGTAHQNGFELSMGVNGRTAHGNWIRIDGFCGIQEHTLQVEALGVEQPVPGVPGGTAGAKGSMRFPFGLSAELGYRYVSELPADLVKNTMIPSYELLHLRTSWTFRWAGSALTTFVHVDNLLDQRYTAFVQVNDPGSRYYNPAPGRSLFLGAAFTWGARG
ncbi:MAG: TonB-dependent receptor [Flavobacteriales bacterium]|nr:TonB-dependent receptor [Flavobacteriales bacterium]